MIVHVLTDYITFCCSPKHAPLFYLELVMDTGGVHYSCGLEEFETVLVGVFDRGIHVTQSVPQLEMVSFNRICTDIHLIMIVVTSIALEFILINIRHSLLFVHAVHC